MVKKKGNKKADATNEDAIDEIAPVEDKVSSEPSNSKKGKKKKNIIDNGDVDYATLLEDESVASPNTVDETSSSTPAEPEKPQAKAKGGKKKKTAVDLDVDYESLLNDDAPVETTPIPTSTPKIEEDAGEEPQRIKSKKEKEKERKQRQKEAEKKKKSATAEPTRAEEQAPETTIDATPKAKKLTKAAAAIREMQERRAREEAEERRIEAELRAKEEAEERIRHEAEQKESEIRAARKEKEKEKKERLKKEGKLLTKSEKERLKQNQLRLAQMQAAGIVTVGDNSEDSAPKKVTYGKKKKSVKKNLEEPLDGEIDATTNAIESLEITDSTPQTVESPPPSQIVEQKEESDTAEDWEKVADSWEDSVTEEAQVSPVKPIPTKVEPQIQILRKKPVEEDDGESREEKKKREAKERREARQKSAVASRSKDDLRSPICCILGHVDTGKTSLLDTIRQSNVQEGEAGGITQQIGATYFPISAIEQKCEVVNKSGKLQFRVPGLLVIDTPGHESFSNLRSRGNSLCNIAVLVIDIMHGLEPQTIESINLLKGRKTPFIIALNKVDRLFSWSSTKDGAIRDSMSKQNKHVVAEFEDRVAKIKVALMEEGLNSELYYKNQDFKRVVSLVPTSAITGEGIPDLLMLILGLTQRMMTEALMFSKEVEGTVLEVKMVEGHGTTIDVILINGVLKEGDRIVLCGMNGPISTNIRALLTPQPMKELRIKSAYVHHKECKAALGIKIAAPELDKAVAGSRLLVVQEGDDEEDLKDEVHADLAHLLSSLDTDELGVCVQASTLGSLEALLDFLKKMKIPVAGISIGPVHKKDVIKAGTVLEKRKEYAVILAFDVKIEKEIMDYATEMGVTIFNADIIYHLFDRFTAHMKTIIEERKKQAAGQAIWPCVLKIVPGCVFNKTDPIIIGVEVTEGTLRLGTPICVPSKEGVVLGKASSIEHNHKQQDSAKKGLQVALKLDPIINEGSRVFGRHFEEKDVLCSKITRESIDALKAYFKDEVSKEEWLVVKKLKVSLNIP